jgi:hypothetical protein
MPLVLPDLCEFTGTLGNADDWRAYENELYGHFGRDFLERRPVFRGAPVNVLWNPLEGGKVPTFWHVITSGPRESRSPEMGRCRRIRWLAPLIEADEADRRVWVETRDGRTNLCIGLPTFEFVLFLQQYPAAYRLITAYYVEWEGRREKYRREWSAHKR